MYCRVCQSNVAIDVTYVCCRCDCNYCQTCVNNDEECIEYDDSNTFLLKKCVYCAPVSDEELAFMRAKQCIQSCEDDEVSLSVSQLAKNALESVESLISTTNGGESSSLIDRVEDGVVRVVTSKQPMVEKPTDVIQKLSGQALKIAPISTREEARERRRQSADVVDNAGSQWFDLPATELTEELKNDLKALRMRAHLDPKRFYKRERGSVYPKYFHVGKVIEGPAEYYSSRLTKKQRKGRFTDEVIADKKTRDFLKRRVNKLQAERAFVSRRKKRPKRHKRS